MSVIFVTHDIGAAVEIADRMAIMYAGRIVEEGAVADDHRPPLPPLHALACWPPPWSPRMRGRPLPAIPGAPPDLGQLPAGCAFAARCPAASAQCLLQVPVTVATGPHPVACWHPLSTGASLRAAA